MLIDEKKLKDLIRKTDFYFVSKTKFLKQIEDCRVPIKSPEEVEQAIKKLSKFRCSVDADLLLGLIEKREMK